MVCHSVFLFLQGALQGALPCCVCALVQVRTTTCIECHRLGVLRFGLHRCAEHSAKHPATAAPGMIRDQICSLLLMLESLSSNGLDTNA